MLARLQLGSEGLCEAHEGVRSSVKHQGFPIIKSQLGDNRLREMKHGLAASYLESRIFRRTRRTWLHLMKDTDLRQSNWERCSTKPSGSSLSVSQPWAVNSECYIKSLPVMKNLGRHLKTISHIPIPKQLFQNETHYDPINGNPIKLKLNRTVSLLCLILVKRSS